MATVSRMPIPMEMLLGTIHTVVQSEVVNALLSFSTPSILPPCQSQWQGQSIVAQFPVHRCPPLSTGALIPHSTPSGTCYSCTVPVHALGCLSVVEITVPNITCLHSSTFVVVCRTLPCPKTAPGCLQAGIPLPRHCTCIHDTRVLTRLLVRKVDTCTYLKILSVEDMNFSCIII